MLQCREKVEGSLISKMVVRRSNLYTCTPILRIGVAGSRTQTQTSIIYNRDYPKEDCDICSSKRNTRVDLLEMNIYIERASRFKISNISESPRLYIELLAALSYRKPQSQVVLPSPLCLLNYLFILRRHRASIDDYTVLYVLDYSASIARIKQSPTLGYLIFQSPLAPSPYFTSLPVFAVPYLSSYLPPTPALKINNHRHTPASRDDPHDVLVRIIYFLVFGPGWDEGEIAGGKRVGF
jgi:hypothetical protein